MPQRLLLPQKRATIRAVGSGSNPIFYDVLKLTFDPSKKEDIMEFFADRVCMAAALLTGLYGIDGPCFFGEGQFFVVMRFRNASVALNCFSKIAALLEELRPLLNADPERYRGPATPAWAETGQACDVAPGFIRVTLVEYNVAKRSELDGMFSKMKVIVGSKPGVCRIDTVEYEFGKALLVSTYESEDAADAAASPVLKSMAKFMTKVPIITQASVELSAVGLPTEDAPPPVAHFYYKVALLTFEPDKKEDVQSFFSTTVHTDLMGSVFDRFDGPTFFPDVAAKLTGAEPKGKAFLVIRYESHDSAANMAGQVNGLFEQLQPLLCAPVEWYKGPCTAAWEEVGPACSEVPGYYRCTICDYNTEKRAELDEMFATLKPQLAATKGVCRIDTVEFEPGRLIVVASYTSEEDLEETHSPLLKHLAPFMTKVPIICQGVPCLLLDQNTAPPSAQKHYTGLLPEPSGASTSNTKIIFVLGGPGSGKGTQCAKLVEKFGFQHVSAGDLLRAEVKSGSEIGKMCETMMKEGKIVPMEVTIGLLRKSMETCTGDYLLIDGFPRKLDQGQAFEKDVKPCSAVLFFDCPEEVMQERLLERGKTSGRVDDNLETIKKRFDTFTEQSMPVVEHYAKLDKVCTISAVPGPDEVHGSVVKELTAKGISVG
jgi:UMP-CMP kinase family protein